MKKFLLFLFLLFPLAASANISVGWSATSTTQGTIFPTPINGVAQSISVGTTSPSFIGNFNTVEDASQYPGADIGAKINSAYAALPSTGGRITVPSGSYSFTTPIVFNTVNKVVNLYCPSGGGASNSAVGGTTLTFTATTGAAITVNTNNYIVAGVGIDNCNIQGTNGTTARSTIGVSEGGTHGAFAFYLRGVNVNGFGTGVQFNSNTSFNVIDSSTIHFNGRNVDEPDTAGANCENMRITNSVIADANNQAGGVTDLYGMAVQESGNCQWNIMSTSFDDNQIYINQFGGTANVWTITNVHFENPNGHTYNYIDTLSNVPATEVNIIGGDMMNDVVGGMPSFISMGGDVHFDGTTIDGNNNVVTPVTAIVSFDNSLNTATASWIGLKNNGVGATYVYGTVPFSPWGYGTGLNLGPSFYIGPASASLNGTTTIANLGGVWDATTFPGADIGAQVNAAYAAASGKKGITINIPNGRYSFSTPIVFGVDGRRALLQGSPAEGVELDYTGTGCAITINDGDQGVGIDHTSGNGLRDLYIRGNNYATTSPQIGVCVGGSQGTDGAVLLNVNIFHFGYGLETRANAYHFMFQNGTIRDNGQNVHIDTPSNSGESMDFLNAFIIDGANHDPFDCFFVDQSGAASLNIMGGGIDDCQIHVGQAVGLTMTGVHMENVGSANAGGWGKYTYIVVDNNSVNTLDMNGGTIYATASVASGNVPDQYIQAGGKVTLNGVNVIKNANTATSTNLVTLFSSGTLTWNGLTNGRTAYNFVTTGYPYTVNGSTATSSLSALGIGTSTPAALLDVYSSVASSTPLLLESISGGGCALIKDVFGGGYTQIYTQAGQLFGLVHTGSLNFCN